MEPGIQPSRECTVFLGLTFFAHRIPFINDYSPSTEIAFPAQEFRIQHEPDLSLDRMCFDEAERRWSERYPGSHYRRQPDISG